MDGRQLRNVNIGIGVDNQGTRRLSGIPEDAWEAFERNAKVHFPDAGDNAWAHMISEIIVASIGRSTFILTDIPEKNNLAFEALLKRVNWAPDQFFVYLLTAAVKNNLLRILSFIDQPQEFGTIIITGIRPSTLNKLEQQVGVTTEDYFGLLLNAIEAGEMKVDPPDAFTKLAAARSGRNPDSQSTS